MFENHTRDLWRPFPTPQLRLAAVARVLGVLGRLQFHRNAALFGCGSGTGLSVLFATLGRTSGAAPTSCESPDASRALVSDRTRLLPAHCSELTNGCQVSQVDLILEQIRLSVCLPSCSLLSACLVQMRLYRQTRTCGSNISGSSCASLWAWCSQRKTITSCL